MQNKLEVINFFKEQLNKIHFIDCYFDSNHGINLSFTLINKVDLSKKHPDKLYFYNKEGKWIMDYNKKRNDFCLSHNNMCSKLKEDFVLNVQEIKEVTQSTLEEQFKCKVNSQIRFF